MSSKVQSNQSTQSRFNCTSCQTRHHEVEESTRIWSSTFKTKLLPEQAKPKCKSKRSTLPSIIQLECIYYEQEESLLQRSSHRTHFYHNAMILRFCILLLGLPSLCWSWSSSPLSTKSFRPAILTTNFMSSEQQFPGEMDMLGSSELVDNPCWQDIYDDDCSMSNIYSANFIAGNWIKSMPCGAGIEVRIGDLFLL